MSEITRYDVDGREWEILEVGDGDYVRHADHLIYLREMRMDRDVERLRADTAEAELEVLRQQHAEQSCIFCNNSGELLSAVKTERFRADAAVGDANEAERRLAAAEQRIAELVGLLRNGIDSIEELLTARDTRELLVDLGAWTINASAALNQKSEGESQ